MSKDSLDTIFRSAAKFFSGTFLSRISGMLRDMSMAFSFGTEGALSTFFIAFRFSHLGRRLLGEGPLQSAFIPHFEEKRLQGVKEAFYFYRDLSLFLSLILAGIIFLSMGSLGASLYFFTMSEESRNLIWLTFLMMPSLFFICLYGLNTALLECEKSYFIPSVAPVAFNIVWIMAAIALSSSVPAVAMTWLSLAVILGCFAQWAITIPRAKRSIQGAGLSSFWENAHPFSKEILKLIKPFLFANIGVAASQINNALDPLFALYANSEGPAWLWYAIRLQQLPLSLFGIALSGALLPPLSRAIKAADEVKFKSFLNFACTKVTAIMIPMTLAIFCMGQSGINLIYGRGHFQEESIIGTTYCLWGYASGLLPMALILLAAPAFYALNDYKTPMRASLYSMALNIFLNAFFILGLKLGSPSVAWATSIASWVNLLYLFFALAKKAGPLKFFSLNESISKILLCGIGGAFAVFFADWIFFQDMQTFDLILGEKPAFSLQMQDQAVRFLAEAASFLAGTLGIAWLIKAKEMALFQLGAEESFSKN